MFDLKAFNLIGNDDANVCQTGYSWVNVCLSSRANDNNNNNNDDEDDNIDDDEDESNDEDDDLHRRVYKERLGLPMKMTIGYQSHADTATKSGSTTKNKFVV